MHNITQEMVDVAETAHRTTCIVGAGIENRTETVTAIIAKVYPLILEQAAKVCETMADESRFSVRSVACDDCTQAIRNLKDKTDA